MYETQQTRQDQFRIGLILRLGGRSWFWGRGTPPAPRVSSQPAPSPVERWPGLAEWLRQMHATQALLDATSTDAVDDKPEQNNPADVPSRHSGATRGIRFVCTRRVIGLLIN
jgi:hypothetical protein